MIVSTHEMLNIKLLEHMWDLILKPNNHCWEKLKTSVAEEMSLLLAWKIQYCYNVSDPPTDLYIQYNSN
jgi:hypothetical protein